MKVKDLMRQLAQMDPDGDIEMVIRVKEPDAAPVSDWEKDFSPDWITLRHRTEPYMVSIGRYSGRVSLSEYRTMIWMTKTPIADDDQMVANAIERVEGYLAKRGALKNKNKNKEAK